LSFLPDDNFSANEHLQIEMLRRVLDECFGSNGACLSLGLGQDPKDRLNRSLPSGTLLLIPIAELAQHLLLGLCYFLQNVAVIRGDAHDCPIPGIEKFKNFVDVEQTWPLTFVEQWSLIEVTAEPSTSCYAGVPLASI
jgi:hypothetical protein